MYNKLLCLEKQFLIMFGLYPEVTYGCKIEDEYLNDYELKTRVAPSDYLKENAPCKGNECNEDCNEKYKVEKWITITNKNYLQLLTIIGYYEIITTFENIDKLKEHILNCFIDMTSVEIKEIKEKVQKIFKD